MSGALLPCSLGVSSRGSGEGLAKKRPCTGVANAGFGGLCCCVRKEPP